MLIAALFTITKIWKQPKCPSENLQTVNAGEGVEKREPSCTVGGNVNCYSLYVEQCGGSLKNWE